MRIHSAGQAHIREAAEFVARGIVVAIESLSKRYGGREVLKSVHLDIAAGEFVAVVGRSGCGKSTLLRLIAGLEQQDGGDIVFGRRAQQPEIRILFQDSRLLPWKRVRDNVTLGLRRVADTADAAADALNKVGLADRAGDWPAVLSGGQRQRVALARALVHEPQLLLLDEPLGALDALTRIDMQQLIESLWLARGFTAVLVTHDVQEAIALADRVVLIEDGQITLDEVIDLPRPRARGSAAFARLEDGILTRLLRRPARESDAPFGDISLLKTVSQVAWAI
jgi:sulfonate transport system ATP-binding protein